MNRGAITDYIDVAQLVLYAFWIFFAGLVWYLRREDKREGYPLETEDGAAVAGFPSLPTPKSFLLADGSVVQAPRAEGAQPPLAAVPLAGHAGAPLVPTGDPMRDGVGPAAYALRADKPDLTLEGEPLIAPLRRAPEFGVDAEDPDPRGMTVLGADEEAAGTVSDLWIDRAEPQIRYFEVDIGTRRVLLPGTMARVDADRRRIRVKSIRAAQFAGVPALANPDQVTRLEEDKIMAYYASGHLYGYAARQEPFL